MREKEPLINGKENVFSFEDTLKFEKECSALLEKFTEIINNVGKLELPNVTQTWIRTKKLLFVKDMILLFQKRSKFIIQCIVKDNEDLEVLRSILRGLIDSYCRILYLNKGVETNEEKIKKIIWREIYPSAMILTDKFLTVPLVASDYQILNQIGVKLEEGFPHPGQLIMAVQRFLRDLDRKEINRIENKFDLNFPSSLKIIKDYLEEKNEPKIPKTRLAYYYAVFSEQFHSNVLLEAYKSPVDVEYQLIGLLIILELKLLKDVAELVNQGNKTVDDLIKKWREEFTKEFAKIYRAARRERGLPEMSGRS